MHERTAEWLAMTTRVQDFMEKRLSYELGERETQAGEGRLFEE